MTQPAVVTVQFDPPVGESIPAESLSMPGGAALEADHCYNSDDTDAVAEMETIQPVASPAAAPLAPAAAPLAGAPQEDVESSYPPGSWASPAAAPRLQIGMQLHLPQSWWPEDQLPECGYWLGTIVGISEGSQGSYLVECACDGYEASQNMAQEVGGDRSGGS